MEKDKMMNSTVFSLSDKDKFIDKTSVLIYFEIYLTFR